MNTNSSRQSASSFCLLFLLAFSFINSTLLAAQQIEDNNANNIVTTTDQQQPEEGNQQTTGKRKLKILVYSPTFGWSHMQFMGRVADTLVDAGHEVVFIFAFPFRHFLRLFMHERFVGMNETAKAHKIYDVWPATLKTGELDVTRLAEIGDPFSGQGFAKLLFPTNIWCKFNDLFALICQEFAQNSELIAQLEAEHFDVGLAELYNLCPFGLMRRIGVRTPLGTLAIPLFQITARHFGIPSFSSYVTNLVAPMRSAPLMNFWDRCINFYNDIFDYYYLTDQSIHMEQPILRRFFGADFPDLRDIGRNISLLFVNSHPFFEMPRPLSKKIVHVGGLVDMRARPLDPEIAQLFDSAVSPDGVVLVSFGSVVETQRMGQHLKLAFLRAFAAFPGHIFIWKFDLTEADAKLFAEMAPNVRPMKWLDQKSILLHPRLRAFLTHCGQNSMGEAARAGVPLVAVPLFGDQLYNTIVARLHGMAVELDIRELNADEPAEAHKLIISALDRVLREPSYRSSAQLVAKKFALTPFSARDRLVQWVEFAAQFPNQPLNELNLPWSDELGLLAFYSVDVILFSSAVLCLAIIVLWCIGRRLVATLLIWTSRWRRPAAASKKRNGRTKLKGQ